MPLIPGVQVEREVPLAGEFHGVGQVFGHGLDDRLVQQPRPEELDHDVIVHFSHGETGIDRDGRGAAG